MGVAEVLIYHKLAFGIFRFQNAYYSQKSCSADISSAFWIAYAASHFLLSHWREGNYFRYSASLDTKASCSHTRGLHSILL